MSPCRRVEVVLKNSLRGARWARAAVDVAVMVVVPKIIHQSPPRLIDRTERKTPNEKYCGLRLNDNDLED